MLKEFKRILNKTILTSILQEHILLEREQIETFVSKFPEEKQGDIGKLISIDPTSKGGSIGKYTNWLVKLYNENPNIINDLDEIKEVLSNYKQVFAKLPAELKDITKFKSVEELKEKTSEFIENVKTEKEATQGDGWKILSVKNNYKLVEVTTYEAWRYWSSVDFFRNPINSVLPHWCTTAQRHHWDEYTLDGDLPKYMILVNDGSPSTPKKGQTKENDFSINVLGTSLGNGEVWEVRDFNDKIPPLDVELKLRNLFLPLIVNSLLSFGTNSADERGTTLDFYLRYDVLEAFPKELGSLTYYFFVSSKTKKYGVFKIDDSHRIILPPKYDSISLMDRGLFKVKHNNKEALFDLQGDIYLDFIYDKIEFFYKNRSQSVQRDDFAIVCQGLKFGVIDVISEEVILDLIYDNIKCVYTNKHTYYHIIKDKLYGLMDTDCNILIEPQYIFMSEPFIKRDPRFVVTNRDGTLKIIDDKNNTIIKTDMKAGSYKISTEFKSETDLYKFVDFKTRYSGLLSAKDNGTIVLEPEYSDIQSEFYGTFTIFKYHEKAHFWKHRKGLVDGETGEMIIEPVYAEIIKLDKEGFYSVKDPNTNLCGLYKAKRGLITKAEFGKISNSSITDITTPLLNLETNQVEQQTFFDVSKNKLWGLINEFGEILIEPEYSEPIEGIYKQDENIYKKGMLVGLEGKVYGHADYAQISWISLSGKVVMQNIDSVDYLYKDLFVVSKPVKGKSIFKKWIVDKNGETKLALGTARFEGFDIGTHLLLLSHDYPKCRLYKIENNTIEKILEAPDIHLLTKITGEKTRKQEDGMHVKTRKKEEVKFFRYIDNDDIYDGTVGLIDMNGKKIIGGFDSIYLLTADADFIIVRKESRRGDLYGCLNWDGELVVPVKYRTVQEAVSKMKAEA